MRVMMIVLCLFFVSCAAKTVEPIIEPIQNTNQAPPETLASFGQWSPAQNAILSRSYGIWTPDTTFDTATYKTCSQEKHDQYWVVGKPNGKIYPTWHPPFETNAQNNIVCYYGHEHGRDPREYPYYNDLIKLRGGVPFGLVNEHYADFINNPTQERKEDHVGHKIEYAHYRAAYGNPANGGNEAQADDLYDAGFDCDILIKLHMGTHSIDAFTNHLHELIETTTCEDGTAYSLAYLKPIGLGGEFDMGTTGTSRTTGLTPIPDGINDIGRTGAQGNNGNGSGDKREIPTNSTINTWSLFGGLDIWSLNTNFKWNNGTSESSLGYGPYMSVFNPARVYNMTHQHTTGTTNNMTIRTIDLCYETINNTEKRKNDTLCKTLPSNKPAWNSPDSSMNGTWRNVNFKAVNIYNANKPSQLYLSYLGNKLETTPFAGSLEIYIAPINNNWGYCTYTIGTKIPDNQVIPKACKVSPDRTVLQRNITGSLTNARAIPNDPNGKYKGLGFTKEYVVNHNYYPPVFGVPNGTLNPQYTNWNTVDTNQHRLAGIHAPN
jgi:hypothetical protein